MVFEWRHRDYLGGDSINYSKAKNILITFKTLLRLLRKYKEEVYSVISLSLMQHCGASIISMNLKQSFPALEMAALNESRRKH